MNPVGKTLETAPVGYLWGWIRQKANTMAHLVIVFDMSVPMCGRKPAYGYDKVVKRKPHRFVACPGCKKAVAKVRSAE